MSADKSVVMVGEEFSIDIQCTLRDLSGLRLSPVSLDGEFVLKVVLPDGFLQTAGNYYHAVSAKLLRPGDKVTYRLTGKFVSRPSSRKFMLLRGTKHSVTIDRFLYRGELAIAVDDRNPTEKVLRGTAADAFSQCLEAESMSGANGPVTSDPNASNGQTRGAENQYNHFVDYIVNVPAAGVYQVTLRYYSSVAPVVNVTVNGGNAQSIALPNSGSWNIAYTEHTFAVSLNAGVSTLKIAGTGGGSCRQDKICVAADVQTCAVMNKVRLHWRTADFSRLNGAKIQGSNDGSTWTDIYMISVNATGSWQEFTFPNATPYQHVRYAASPAGYGELREIEFYSGIIKLSGTAFGSDPNVAGMGWQYAVDGVVNASWHGQYTGVGAHAGPSNFVGLSITGCATTCIKPSVVLTAGTAVCPATNQQVTLTASGYTGNVSWLLNGSPVGNGPSITTANTGAYAAFSTNGACASGQSNTFTVAQAANCAVPALVPKVSSSGFPEILTLSIVPDPANPGGWLLNDLGTVNLPAGYEWSYFIGNKWLRTGANLTNEPWQSSSPGRVVKMATKIGLDTLNRWPCPPEGCNYYYQNDAVAQLAPGARGGLTTFIFN
ncbi:carbohydrate-binding protein [Dyadobacter sp. 676]|uniref:Carbohydrate-binding protein n=1 Tax=Dyadobacter sp. 676 TaxID=3088362 RepID=A0AAU8FTD7_9BACT